MFFLIFIELSAGNGFFSCNLPKRDVCFLDMSLGFNPCLEKACHSYATCKVVNGSQAVCVCPQNCTAIKQPVCGANWKTYDNLCSLLAESCQRNEWNSLQYNGECKLVVSINNKIENYSLFMQQLLYTNISVAEMKDICTNHWPYYFVRHVW